MKLVSEKVLKEVVIVAMEKVVKLTKTDVDDNLLKVVKDAWEVKEV